MTALAALLLLATPALADPALWLIRSPHATVYTKLAARALRQHPPPPPRHRVGRPVTEWEGPPIHHALETADECWFEVKIPEDPSSLLPLVMQLGFDPTHSLIQSLPPEQLQKLVETTLNAGLPTSALDPVRPWSKISSGRFPEPINLLAKQRARALSLRLSDAITLGLAAITLVTTTLEHAGFNPDKGADVLLQAQAKAAGKPVHGFETLEQQLHFLADSPPELGRSFLLSNIDDAQIEVTVMDGIVRHWIAGDIDFMAKTVGGHVRQEAPELYRVLLTDRNTAWAATIADMNLNAD